MNKLPNTETVINLKGILIGNGCTNPRECYQPDQENSMSIYQYQFLYNHNYLTEKDYTYVTGSCTLGYRTAGCRQIRQLVDAKFDSTLSNINNIYQPCFHQKIPKSTRFQLQSKIRKTVGDFQTCDDLKGIYHFFNQPLMFEYLHVDPVSYDICSDQVASKYKSFPNASQWLYP